MVEIEHKFSVRIIRRGTSLGLYMNNVRVGSLKKLPTGAMQFNYEPSWIVSPTAIPLSTSLPLAPKTYSGDVVINYFDNLLPDNDGIRKALAQRMALKSQEVYDLLAAIGRDCVGAVQLIPTDEEPSLETGIQSVPISDKEIEKILKSLKSFPLGVRPGDDFRISIAGAQEKTAFLKVKNAWHVPKGSTPSSHIFKVQMGMIQDGIDMTKSIENEWLCMQICKEFGLPTANCEIQDFGETRALVVERFDREFTDGKVLRYAQEDFCQVFGISPAAKYENKGGPGIVQIVDALTRSDNPNEDKATFLKSQIVFWLLGAIDGHAKNFSVFLVPQGIKLTPLYDVMSAYPPIRKRQLEYEKAALAMAVGDKRTYRLRDIVRRHWLQTAKKASFPDLEMNKIIDQVIELTPNVIANIESKLPNEFPEEISSPILEGMAEARSALVED